jgi:hypothetical protein
MPIPEVAGKADFLHAHLANEEIDDFLCALRFGLPLDARVDVLGVFAKDHHVGFLG